MFLGTRSYEKSMKGRESACLVSCVEKCQCLAGRGKLTRRSFFACTYQKITDRTALTNKKMFPAIRWCSGLVHG